MEEKRKNKRLDLDVNVQLERLDEDGVTTLKFVHVDVTDISKSGIGFDCKKKLEMNSYYDAKIQIWTKEVVDAVIQIVRSEEKPDGFHYGGVFIGMTDTDALKIEMCIRDRYYIGEKPILRRESRRKNIRGLRILN